MTWFQNPFTQEFRGNLVLGDRAYSPVFQCPSNKGRGDELVVSWNNGPFVLNGNDSDATAAKNLVIQYSTDASQFANWYSLSVDVTSEAASAASVSPAEVVASLTANATFASLFTASIDTSTTSPKVSIAQKKPATSFRFYIVNGAAEEKLGFNARAGIAELPSYFARHNVGNVSSFSDSVNLLVELDTGNNVDKAVIDSASDIRGNSLGFSSGTVQADSALLRGKSGVFTVKKQTVNATNQVTEIIEYPAGAKVGDLAKKITMAYTSTVSTYTNPTQIVEVPHVLTSGDII